MSRIKIKGSELFVESRGEGLPLVLLNPGAMDLRAWDDQVPDFSGRFRVVRYDYRCTGRSDRFEGAFSHRRDLETLMNLLNIEKSCLVGASFGGSLAIDFAMAHPDRVAALVVLGGGGPQNGFPLPSELVEKLTPIVLAAREDLPRAVEMWLRVSRMPSKKCYPTPGISPTWSSPTLSIGRCLIS